MIRSLLISWICITLLIFLLIAGLFLSSGYWFPLAAPTIFNAFDVKIGQAHRGDDGRMRFLDVSYQEDDFRVEVHQMEWPTPLQLVVDRIRRDSAFRAPVVADGVELRLMPAALDKKADTAGRVPGPGERVPDVFKVLETTEAWLPPFILRNVKIQPDGPGEPGILKSIEYRAGEIQLKAAAWNVFPDSAIQINWTESGVLRFKATATDFALTTRFTIKEISAEGFQLEGFLRSADDEVHWNAQWNAEDWIPVSASLCSEQFAYPAGLGMGPVPLHSLRIRNLHAEWMEHRFTLDGEDFQYQEIKCPFFQLRFQAEAPVLSPQHRGTLKVHALDYPPLRPIDLVLDWKGRGMDSMDVAFQVNGAEADEMLLDVNFLRDGELWFFTIKDGTWYRAEEKLLTLSNPARIRLNARQRTEWPWKGFLVDSLRLQGEVLTVGLDWNGDELDLAISVLDASLIAPWLRVNALRMPAGFLETHLPDLGKVEITLVVDANRVVLQNGFLEMRDSGVRLSGAFPFPVLLQSLETRTWDWEELLPHLEMNAELVNWKTEVWKDYIPDIFRSSGEISGKVEIRPGLELSGDIAIDGFALRSTLYSPPVEGVRAVLQFRERSVHLINAEASVGGGNLDIHGTMDWTDLAMPRYELKVKGGNVPVLRTQDMILRSDIDVRLWQPEDHAHPVIEGDLELQASTMLIDMDPLSPQIEAGPGTVPPFFSISEFPFSEWGCNLSIRGQKFLRVRSPYFSTELSATFDVTGTLGQPLLIGSVWADDGRLQFPGSTMRIESAEAFITPEKPNTLQLEADAIAQTRTYVITMNVTGSVDQPRVFFSSTPTLSNTQILRLLATGSFEGGGAGAIGLYLGQAFLGPGTGEDTLADRISVEIGQEVTESGRSTLEVNYELNDRWSLEGEYDRFNTYNLNLIRILYER